MLQEDKALQELLNSIRAEASREVALSNPAVASVQRAGHISEGIEWLEEPVPFYEFVNNPFHLGQPSLSKMQRQDLEDFLGDDPRRIFNPDYVERQLAVLMCGKGSGKDWICTMLQPYLVYLLLCTKNPHGVLGLAPNENIDVMNVAYSAEQANEVYFTKFLHRLYHWPWLRERYPIVSHGKILNLHQHPEVRLASDGSNHVRVGADRVRFPHSIRAISEHSENESYEGYNVLFFVMDEAAAFRSRGKKANAHKVFGTLRTSAASRFPHLWRGVIISWPREESDFMMHMYRLGQNDPTILARKRATWEWNPTVSRADLQKEYDRYPVESKAKFECEPPPRVGAAFDPDAVDRSVKQAHKSLIITSEAILDETFTEPTTGRTYPMRFVGKMLEDVLITNLAERSVPRVFHVDGGLTGCSAGLIVAHAEPVIYQNEALNKVVVDVVLRWTPNPKRKLQVSLNNIAAIICEIANRTNLVYGTYDQWNSQSSLEALGMSGIPVEKHNVEPDDYALLEQLFNIGCVELPGDDYSASAQLVDEVKNIVRYRRGDRLRYDVPQEEDGMVDETGAPAYTKDLADCLAGVARALNMMELRAAVVGTYAPRMVLGNSGTGTSDKTPFNPGNSVPQKYPQVSFPDEAGYMGRQMGEAHEATKTHKLLTTVNGDIRLKGVNLPSFKKPPRIIRG